jgi:hypothetical protein
MTFYDDKAATINALVTSVEAIEMELGLLPAGVYATVRTRLDILEARINNPFAPAPNVPNPFYIGGSPVSGVSIQAGFGDPTITKPPAIPGSLYLREDGYNIQGLYAFRPDGYWHMIDTDPFTAAGDLSGTIYSQTVIGLQNRAINPAAPITDAEGDGYVLTWNATANAGHGWWEPQIGFYAFGDLTGNKINQTVVNLQGTKLVIGIPQDGYSLVWNGTTSQWEPQRQAVVFDPLDTSSTTNVRTNRFTTQSPLGLGILGANNLSSRSVGATTGVTANYASILGGDQNQVSGPYSSIVGGSLNVAGGQYSVVVGGLANTANATESFIGSGNANAISGTGSYLSILNGQSNTIGNGFNPNFANILGGSTNLIDQSGSFSTILGGFTNTIHSTVNGYNLIGQGTLNIISAGVTETTILNGNGNTVTAGVGSFVHGDNNSVASSYTMTQGINNNIGALGKFVGIWGDVNVAGAGGTNSHYSAIWGCGNTVNDGYIAMFGLHNMMNAGSTFADIHGDVNTVSSAYTSIWGSQNTIGTTDGYTAIFGSGNNIGNNSANSFVVGANNTVHPASANAFAVGTGNSITDAYSSAWGSTNVLAAAYSSAWGSGNSVTQTVSGYSNVWGQSNTVVGDYNVVAGSNIGLTGNYSTAWGQYITLAGSWSTAYGYYHANITANDAFVHGQFGQAINSGQYTHAANNFGGVTAGVSQFSRMVLNGTGVSGAAITLTTDGTHNVNTENAKAYDMEVRILVTDTVSAGVCARYVFGVLGHTEGGSFVYDRIDAVLLNSNGTGWVADTGANAWTGIFTTSGTQMVITLPSFGSNTRRAMATVEWSELRRN